MCFKSGMRELNRAKFSQPRNEQQQNDENES